jgi:dihydroxyacid dehydratase/phosphogluconate dehydratase
VSCDSSSTAEADTRSSAGPVAPAVARIDARARMPRCTQGVLAKYARLVSSASTGAVTD